MLGEGAGARNNTEYVRHFRRTLREENPQAYVLGEHFFEATAWLQGDQEDGAMNYYGFGLPVRAFLAGLDHREQPVHVDAGDLEYMLHARPRPPPLSRPALAIQPAGLARYRALSHRCGRRPRADETRCHAAFYLHRRALRLLRRRGGFRGQLTTPTAAAPSRGTRKRGTGNCWRITAHSFGCGSSTNLYKRALSKPFTRRVTCMRSDGFGAKRSSSQRSTGAQNSP